MRNLRLEIDWKLNRIKYWWNNQSHADRMFLYVNSLFVFVMVGIPLLGMLFGWEL